MHIDTHTPWPAKTSVAAKAPFLHRAPVVSDQVDGLTVWRDWPSSCVTQVGIGRKGSSLTRPCRSKFGTSRTTARGSADIGTSRFRTGPTELLAERPAAPGCPDEQWTNQRAFEYWSTDFKTARACFPYSLASGRTPDASEEAPGLDGHWNSASWRSVRSASVRFVTTCATPSHPTSKCPA